MSVRRAAGAAAALVVYVYAILAAPWFHQAHHARFGFDHVHDAAGVHPFGGSAAHEAFHADLGALSLDEAASAGTLGVDCELCEYTMVECGGAEAPSHAPRFGDALVAHRHPAPPPDPAHGRGTLEHASAALIAPSLLVLPPPARPLREPVPRCRWAYLASLARPAPQARGPPRSCASS